MKSSASQVSIALVFAWVAWTTFWDAGLYGDNVEQFVWVHSLEWGYHKHPPMPTWILGLAIQLVGQHSWLTNALAALCFAITGALTWQIARKLFDERIANTAIVLWTLQQCFSLSAQIYNHNTVLVMFLAATVLSVISATGAFGKRQIAWWMGAGIFAGCAMLSKYQAALPLGVLLVTICIIHRQSGKLLWRGLAIASGCFVVVTAPHLVWAISNDFPTLRYASGAIESGSLIQRVGWIATFFVNQIRMVLPLLLALGLSLVLCKVRRAPGMSHSNVLPQSPHASPWLWGLVWAPVALLLVTSVISGSQLRNHWGVQLFQFLAIWLAWQWRGSPALKLVNLLPAALVIHAVSMGYYAIKQSNPEAVQAERRADSAYPAERMAEAALAHWKTQTNCPLTIIQGDFEAGLVSAFSAGFPLVYTNPVATPWIAPTQLAQQGALYVLDMNTPLPPQATAAKNWYLGPAPLPSAAAAGSGKYVQFAVRLPLAGCS